MKKLLILFAAVALLAACGKSNDQQSMTNDQIILDNIQSRVSVRQFTGEKILQEHVEKLLHAAMAAPSAINKQPWAFIVVTDNSCLTEWEKKCLTAVAITALQWRLLCVAT